MKLQKITRKRLIESTAYEDFGMSDGEAIDEAEVGDEDSDTVQAYTMYVTDVMSAIAFYADPTINLETMMPGLKDAAKTAVRITKYLFKVIVLILCKILSMIILHTLIETTSVQAFIMVHNTHF